MSITATVENDMIRLPPGVHLPDGTTVTVESAEVPRAGDDFGHLAGQEAALRARLEQTGRLFAALDRVREFSVAGKLTREELHAR